MEDRSQIFHNQKVSHLSENGILIMKGEIDMRNYSAEEFFELEYYIEKREAVKRAIITLSDVYTPSLEGYEMKEKLIAHYRQELESIRDEIAKLKEGEGQ